MYDSFDILFIEFLIDVFIISLILKCTLCHNYYKLYNCIVFLLHLYLLNNKKRLMTNICYNNIYKYK